MEKFSFEYELFNHKSALGTEDLKLIEIAFDAAKRLAYAPYSKFQVGAAVLLSNGVIIPGSNQENAASPVGICAERGALSSVSNLYPEEQIVAIAIAYQKDNIDPIMAAQVLSPCGTCRQTLAEYVTRQKATFPILLCSASEKVVKIKDVMNLLPLSFGAEML